MESFVELASSGYLASTISLNFDKSSSRPRSKVTPNSPTWFPFSVMSFARSTPFSIAWFEISVKRSRSSSFSPYTRPALAILFPVSMTSPAMPKGVLFPNTSAKLPAAFMVLDIPSIPLSIPSDVPSAFEKLLIAFAESATPPITPLPALIPSLVNFEISPKS